MDNNTKKTRKIVGTVVSDKMIETAVVAVETSILHSKYGKRFKRTTKYKCHNPKNQYKVGDKVTLVESRPLSKEKKWRIIEKIK